MWEFVIEKLISLLGPIATMEKEKRELKNAALIAISTALRETKIYYRDLSSGHRKSRAAENNLSKLWSDAAAPLSHIDQELALICEHKSNYWINPDRYSDDEIERLGIRLESVSSAYMRMLSPALQRQLSPKNSFKPKPLRGSA